MAASGVDGVNMESIREESADNLGNSCTHAYIGGVRRSRTEVSIPKADGRERPLGITTVEDKIVQRAVVEVLNAIYETDFPGFSYGLDQAAAHTMRWMHWQRELSARK